MLFNSFVFLLLFLPVTYVVFWRPQRPPSRATSGSTITGYVFYGYWDARFCLLMAFSTVVSYTAGLGFLQVERPQAPEALPRGADHRGPDAARLLQVRQLRSSARRRRWCTGLGTDVYVPHLNIILPVGISFYTFHTISYIVDSYRGVIRPTRNFFEFSAYVSLFSQLVAGPIVRFRQIEEDLENLGGASRSQWLYRGMSFFVVGLVEKVLIADTLAAFVDPALASYDALSTAGAWLAMLGYSCQLYFDFSGYSTMAVGLGYMFGLRIPQNFNSPYKALDPSDFWRRWHISLSTCMRDYLYIPFGGNRGHRVSGLPQPDADHADRRALARRRMDLRRVGRVSRIAAGTLPEGGPDLGRPADMGPPSFNVGGGGDRLGPVPIAQFRDGDHIAPHDVHSDRRGPRAGARAGHGGSLRRRRMGNGRAERVRNDP